MKIRDTERLLASHTDLANSLDGLIAHTQFVATTARKFGAHNLARDSVDAAETARTVLAEACNVREQIARPL